MKKFFRGVTDALGFTKPKIPDSAVPQVNQTKYGIETQLGKQGLEDMAKWRSDPNNVTTPYYFKQHTVKPVIPQYGKNPTQPMMPANTTFGSSTPQAPTSLVPREAMTQGMQAPDLSQYSSTVRDLLAARASKGAPTQEGYDPARKGLALESLTREIGTQRGEAEKAMRERLGAMGALNSTVGASKLGELGQGYDRQLADAMARVELEDMAAQREDRYRNQDIDMQMVNQLAGLAGTGQGLDLGQFGAQMNVGEFDRSGRGIDRSTEQMDFGNLMNLAQFGREGTAMDVAQMWKRYGGQREADIYGIERSDRLGQDIADRQNTAQLQNIDLETGREDRRMNQFQNYQNMLLSLAGGMPVNDPYSQREADKYALSRGQQQANLGNTFKLLSGFL
jgi:hypothetical protein